jgi:hypothetical protein
MRGKEGVPVILQCVDCGTKFDFPEKDQQFFTEQGWPAPKRCRPCREKAKAVREAKGGGEAFARGARREGKQSRW